MIGCHKRERTLRTLLNDTETLAKERGPDVCEITRAHWPIKELYPCELRFLLCRSRNFLDGRHDRNDSTRMRLSKELSGNKRAIWLAVRAAREKADFVTAWKKPKRSKRYWGENAGGEEAGAAAPRRYQKPAGRPIGQPSRPVPRARPPASLNPKIPNIARRTCRRTRLLRFSPNAGLKILDLE